MPATLTIPNPGTPAGKSIVPNRYPPQPDGPSEDQRFAALMRQRREAQPPASPEARREANAETTPAARPAAPEARDGQQGGDADPAAEGTSASDATLAASTGCAAAKPTPAGKSATRPATDRRGLPIDEVPMLPPQDAADGTTPTTGSAAGDDKHCKQRADEAPTADPALRPGLLPAAADAAASAAHSAPAASGAANDARIGTAGGASTPGAAHPGLPLSGSATGGGRGADHGDDRSARRAADAAASHAAALLDVAMSNTEAIATSTGADRFTLPRTPDSALPGLSGSVTPHRADAGPAPTVALPTPLGAPDFAKALGAQVSLFARNGLAHAELQLTPAEMGPIRVQIAIDGAHARVDFAADSAATRQVIERGLPELASALREQGLTLSGGGVYQRAPDQRRDGDEAPHVASGRAHRRADASAHEVVGVAQRPSARSARPGGVDLYA